LLNPPNSPTVGLRFYLIHKDNLLVSNTSVRTLSSPKFVIA